MQLSNQHKALLLTMLIAGTVVCAVFGMSLKQQPQVIAESFYELTPEEQHEEQQTKPLETTATERQRSTETNKAFNASKKSTHFAQAFQPIAPPEAYTPHPKVADDASTLNAIKTKYKNTHLETPNTESTPSYKKVNALLEKQKQTSNNANSSMSFSLVNRSIMHYNTPIYLCENGGKVVLTITVNSNGNVENASFNTASTSSNECLVKHAIEYAKAVKFNTVTSTGDQIGSITFYFRAKH